MLMDQGRFGKNFLSTGPHLDVSKIGDRMRPKGDTNSFVAWSLNDQQTEPWKDINRHEIQIQPTLKRDRKAAALGAHNGGRPAGGERGVRGRRGIGRA